MAAISLLLAGLTRPLGLFVLVLLPLATFLAIRLAAVFWVRAAMMRAAGKIAALPAPTSAPAAVPPPPLRFAIFDPGTPLELAAGPAALLRAAAEAGRQSWLDFRRGALFALALLFTAAAGWTSLLPFGLPGERGLIWIGWAFLTSSVLLLTALTRTTFRSLQRVPAEFLVACLLAAGAGGGWLLLGVGWPAFALVAALGAGAAIWASGYRRRRRLLAARGDHPLLVLRVFGSDANSAFLFGEIGRRWSFLGTSATIVDPSYLRFQTSLAARGNRRFLGLFAGSFLGFTLATAALLPLVIEPFTAIRARAVSEALGWMGRAELIGFSLCLLLGGAALLFLRRRIAGNFRRTLEEVVPGAAPPRGAESPLSASGMFRQLALHCHDDVWRPAVASLLPKSQAVLMDLRGFSPQRKGCEYELSLLIDRYPIDRVVLITDPAPARDALLAMLSELWQRMRDESPNRALAEPLLAAYSPGAEDPADVDRILALLGARLGVENQEEDVAPSFVFGRQPGPAAPRPGWAAALGRLDLRISHPAAARFAVPALMLLLAFEGYRLAAQAGSAFSAFSAPRMYTAELPAVLAPPAAAEPLRASGHVFTNKPVSDLNSARLHESLDVCVRFEGARVASTSVLGKIEDLIVRGPAGEPLPLADNAPAAERDLEMRVELAAQAVDRPWPGDADFPAATPLGGRRQFCTPLEMDALIDRVSEVKGRAYLKTYEPEQAIVVSELGRLLPERGWIRIANPGIAAAGSLDLLRFGPKKDVEVRFSGDLDRLICRFLLPGGAETRPRWIRSRVADYWRHSVPADEANEVTLQVLLGDPAVEAVDFAVADLEVLVPTRPIADRYSDRILRSLDYEGEPDPWTKVRQEIRRQMNETGWKTP